MAFNRQMGYYIVDLNAAFNVINNATFQRLTRTPVELLVQQFFSRNRGSNPG